MSTSKFSLAWFVTFRSPNLITINIYCMLADRKVLLYFNYTRLVAIFAFEAFVGTWMKTCSLSFAILIAFFV